VQKKSAIFGFACPEHRRMALPASVLAGTGGCRRTLSSDAAQGPECRTPTAVPRAGAFLLPHRMRDSALPS